MPAVIIEMSVFAFIPLNHNNAPRQRFLWGLHPTLIRFSKKKTDDEICEFSGEIGKIIAMLLQVSRILQFLPGGNLVHCGNIAALPLSAII
jgi:hypothetical protein